MMQMLAAGGMPILSDGVRSADEDNPKGYYEFEAVKTTRVDSAWLATAAGKAVKMVSVLIRDLPLDRDYRVILMRRDLEEVLQSQKAMLSRLGKAGARVDDGQLKQLFSKELTTVEAWMNQRTNFRFMTIEYGECVRNQGQIARYVHELLGGELDVAAMAEAVDPNLYRKRLRAE